jgi:hypothetical protein
MFSYELEKFRTHVGGMLSEFLSSITYLENIGLFDLLRLKGNPSIAKDANAMAMEGARAAGYAECLNDITYFKELYLETLSGGARPDMDFGVLEALVSNNEITKEEADAIKRGESPDYDSIAKRINATKRAGT